MGIFSNLFGSKKPFNNPLKWDMHNHILFGIDDGSKSLDYSLRMAEIFVSKGYKKVIATPHIMSDYYPNTPEIIREKLSMLQMALKEASIDLETGCAAEYYMDEYFLDKVRSGDELLSFHGNHVLVETSFMNKPVFFDQLLFEMRTKGFQPVLAHPERYVYFHGNYEAIEQLSQTGVKLQINLLSLIGHYSPNVKKLAQWMIKEGHYNFLGTDAHSVDHLEMLQDVMSTKLFDSIDFDRVENAR